MDSSTVFHGYRARQGGRRLRSLPRAAYQFAKSKLVYDLALLPYATLKHRRLLATCDRTQTHTYTAFYRAPAQLEQLVGPAMAFLGHPERRGERLEILLLACSIGAEAYTIASFLRMRLPQLDFHIRASDLHQETIDRAQAASYSRDEVLHSPYITPEFVAATFRQEGDRFVVLDEVRQRVSFSRANLLDGPDLKAQFGQAPIVCAQNVLFHLKPAQARQAFHNLVALMAPRSLLMVEGMDLDLRVELSEQHQLRPHTGDLRRIYQQTRAHTPADWWNYYWGTEPYVAFRPDATRRYATMFFRNTEGGKADPPWADTNSRP